MINQKIGEKIRYFRKKRNMTLEELSTRIHKCKSMVSKYETGKGSIEINTLYEIANVLEVQIEELLYHPITTTNDSFSSNGYSFFSGASLFYAYYYDGRSHSLNRSVFNLIGVDENNHTNVMLYMNVSNYEHYTVCENTYRGTMEHYDAITIFRLKNVSSPIEHLSISILSNFSDSREKWGLMTGISSRPMMPIALKMLLVDKPLKESKENISRLLISKYDIKLMKQFNMFTSMPFD